jgi:putative protein-disulfide isomerase
VNQYYGVMPGAGPEMQAVLYYIHDPMCSWCWGYRPVWRALQQELPETLRVEYVLGGLAADTDQPMPQDMQEQIQATWRSIRIKLGSEFNFDFWTSNTPRRSTYLSCRAVIVARDLGFEKEMLSAIQEAYYLRAMNPSERDVLLQLAGELHHQGLDLDLDYFGRELESEQTEIKLHQQIDLADTLTHSGFPSLVLEHAGGRKLIRHDYLDNQVTLEQIREQLEPRTA